VWSLFRAIAIDYDGTLTTAERPEPQVLEAIAAVRREDVRVVLVTGRRVDSLLRAMPDARDHFDAIVAENAGVLVRGEHVESLAAAIPESLASALAARGVRFHRGHVLLATWAPHAVTVLDEISRLGLDVQIIRNRGALMLLPPGVTKGAGLVRALGELGVSYHNAIAVGDAENDHAMFEVSELAVAVANAVPSLQEHADVVLGRPAGEGIVELLAGPILRGDVRAVSRRLGIELGEADDGTPVMWPATPSNLLVTGPSGAGKSYVAGAIAERLVRLDYSVCVLDPEGDYEYLAGLRGTSYLGGPSPSPQLLGQLLSHRFGSVVFDTSQVSEARRGDVIREALCVIGCEREKSPWWM